MENINVGVNGISGLVAQVDSQLTLSSWFESCEDRTFVVKFADYCKYMATYGRDGYSPLLFNRAYRIIEKLCQNQLEINKSDANEVITDCYCAMMYDIGVLLIKEVGLYSREDSDWSEFNIRISLPIALKDYFGELYLNCIADAKGHDEFFEVNTLESFKMLSQSQYLLDVILSREDISLQDILKSEGTKLEYLAREGMTYLTLSKNKIKARIVGE